MSDITTPTDTYLSDATYHAMRDRLAKMVAENFDKFCSDPETEVVRVLGEVGGVWPQSVMDDAERC